MKNIEKALESQVEKNAEGSLGAFSQDVSAQRVNRVESMGLDSLQNQEAAVNKVRLTKES